MEGFLILLALAAFVFLRFYFNSPTVIGAEGERRVSSILSRKLGERDFVLLDDLTLPTNKGTTQVDHIVLSRYGIFVIETKNMSGWIFGGENQARWTQTTRRHKSQFQNPLRQNYHHVKVVQGLLGVSLNQIENLVAFVGSAEPKTAMPPNVFWNRHDLFDYINSRRAVQFSADEVRGFTDKLRRDALVANKDTRRAYVQHVQEKAIQRKTDVSKCPRCGSELVERSNRKTGQTFLGCLRFPKCRGTRQVN